MRMDQAIPGGVYLQHGRLVNAQGYPISAEQAVEFKNDYPEQWARVAKAHPEQIRALTQAPQGRRAGKAAQPPAPINTESDNE